VSKDRLRPALYRPFCKQQLLYERSLIERPGKTARLFPDSTVPNIAICTSTVGNRGDYSALVCDVTPDLHMVDKSGGSQCFPLYLYEQIGRASCRERV